MSAVLLERLPADSKRDSISRKAILVPVESRNSRTIGSTSEETENVTLRECGEWDAEQTGDRKNRKGGREEKERGRVRDRTRCRTGSSS